MSINQKDLTRFTTEANRFNFDGVICYLVDEDDPKAVAKQLKLIYFTLAEYVMSDTVQLCRVDVTDAMYTLRCLHEAVEEMTNDDERVLAIMPTSKDNKK